MKKLLVAITLSLLCISLIFIYQTKINSIPGITYFPIDKETGFTEALTSLKLEEKNSQEDDTILWESLSKSDKSMYLRQDVSLLYNLGKLVGVLSKWSEKEATIKLSERINGRGTGNYQAISFHHGEIHNPDGSITSIQKMTADELFVIDDTESGIYSFHQPKSTTEKSRKENILKKKSQTLLSHWNKLLNHFQVNKNDYLLVPLTELDRYNTEPLPSKSQSQTNQIIGQLWEGIYKNYIVPITSEKQNVTSFVPLILFSEDQGHLLVLFEINGKKERLIQQYP